MELEASESFAARIIELKNVTQGECDTREYITRVCASIEPSCDDWNIARVEKNGEDSRTCGVACGVELNVLVDAHTSADEVDGKERDRAGGAIVNATNTLIDETGIMCKNTKHGRVLYGCTWHSFDEDDEAGADVISGGAESNQMTWADIAHEVDQFGRIPKSDILVGKRSHMKQTWIEHSLAIRSNIEQGRVFEVDQHSHNESIWSDLYNNELNDGVDAEPRADIAIVRLFQKSDKIQSVVEEADDEVMSTDVQVSLDLSDMQILSANRLNVDFKRKHAMLLLWSKNELDRIGTVVKLMTSTGKRAKEYVTSFANWGKGGQVRQILHQDDYANWSKGGRIRMSVEEPFCFLRSQLLANRGMDVNSKYRVLNLELGRVSDGVLSQVSVLMEMTYDLYYVTYFVLFYVLNIVESNVSLLYYERTSLDTGERVKC